MENVRERFEQVEKLLFWDEDSVKASNVLLDMKDKLWFQDEDMLRYNLLKNYSAIHLYEGNTKRLKNTLSEIDNNFISNQTSENQLLFVDALISRFECLFAIGLPYPSFSQADFDMIDKAEKILESSNQLSERETKRQIAHLNLCKGILFRNKGNTDKFLDLAQKSEKCYEEIGNICGLSKVLVIIGYFYSNVLRDYDLALPYYEKSLELLKIKENTSRKAYIFLRMGNCFTNKGELDKGFEYSN